MIREKISLSIYEMTVVAMMIAIIVILGAVQSFYAHEQKLI